MSERLIKKNVQVESPVIRLNPLNLTFKGEFTHLEQNFQRDFAANSVKYIRLAFLLGLILYSFFGILDTILMPEEKALLWFIRYAVVCPIIFVCILLSFWSGFQKYSQAFIVLVLMLAGSGISIMVAVAPAPASFSYYAGVILVLMLGYGFVRARFIWASLAGWLNVIIYEIVAIGVVQTPDHILINNNFFFISANIIGMFSCYAFEFYARKDFFMAWLLSTEREKVKELNHNLEKIIHQRTSELQKTNNTLTREIKEREALQSQLIQSEKLASLGQLAAGVAHEINNPVGFVKSNLGTMEEYRLELTKLLDSYANFESITMKTEKINEIPSIKNANESTKKIKEDIDIDFIMDDYPGLIEDSKEGMERVVNIIADLKNFVHMDNAELEYADINNGIESTLNLVGNELKYKAKVIKELGDLPLVKCYPQQLNQIFTNLLVNAAHAIEKKGEIRIFTAKIKDRVIIKISDTGCGIPQNIIDKIYDPFFTTKEAGKGTGLGLNVVYNIIQTHQGTINIESQVGKGSTFIINLPIKPTIVENQAV